MRAKALFALALLFIGYMLVQSLGCKKETSVPQTTIESSEPSGAPASTAKAKKVSAKPKEVEEVAVLDTTQGKIVIELYPDSAPGTVANFKKLIRQKFYDGLTFHRYVKGFVIQGGDPNGDGTGGPGYTIKDEFNDRKHLTGTVAMAKTSAPNSAGSQFYITLAPQPHLDGKYTVFGQVIQGMDNVFKLRKGDKMIKVTLADKSKYVPEEKKR